MRVLGITAEYNPFHNGHAYHIQRAKELAGADAVVTALSGDFTQRGEPAVFDKWARSRDAIRNGADLVIELPFVFACNRAPIFALGGVDSLVRAGATAISFGCEAEDPDALKALANELSEREDELAINTREAMKEGVSHAKAYESSVRSLLGDEAADMILRPNNILAVEYMKRICFWNERGLELEALPVRRKGSGYDEISLDEGFSGASAIRTLIKEDRFDDIKKLVPGNTHLHEAAGEGASLSEEICALDERYYQLIKGILLRSTSEELAEIYCVGEGIENRLKSEIATSSDMESFLNSMVSKRYTASAVRRMLTYIALGLKGDDADRLLIGLDREPLHGYLRVLGASKSGRVLLRDKESGVITNVNRQQPEDELAKALLQLDIKASDLYNLVRGRRLYDYSDKVVRPYIES